MAPRTKDPDPRDDDALVAAARAGDVAAFEAIYRRHRDWVLRAAARILGDDDAALDVLQEVFVYLLRRLPSLDLRARLSTFLFPAVRNLALAARRRRGVHEPLGDEPPAGPEADGGGADAHAELAEVIGALPEGQRDVVLLRYVDDLSLAEIAERLGIPVGTVKSRLHQAIAVLREDPRTRRHFLDERG